MDSPEDTVQLVIADRRVSSSTSTPCRPQPGTAHATPGRCAMWWPIWDPGAVFADMIARSEGDPRPRYREAGVGAVLTEFHKTNTFNTVRVSDPLAGTNPYSNSLGSAPLTGMGHPSAGPESGA